MIKLPTILKKIIDSPFYRNSFTLVSGTFIAQVFLLLISPILARLYSPDDFGLYGSFLAVSTILSMIATGRYELAILLPKEEKRGHNIFALSILFSLLFSILLFGIILLTYRLPFWQRFTSLSGIYLWLLPAGVFLFAITMPAAFLVNRFKNFKILSLGKMIGSGSTGILGLLFGWMGLVPGGLIFSKLIGWLIETGTLIFPFLRKLKTSVWPLQHSRLVKLARKYQNFPKYSTPEGLLNTGFKQIPILALTALFSPELAGFYTLTSSILSKPFGMVSTSFGHVFFQKASEENRSGELKKTFIESLQFLFLLAIVPTVLLFIFAPVLFSWIFGDVWETSGIYARWMLPFFFITYLKSPFSGMVDIKNVISKNLIFEMGFMLIALLAFTIGYAQKDDILALQIFSLGNSLLALIQLNWFYRLLDRKSNW